MAGAVRHEVDQGLLDGLHKLAYDSLGLTSEDVSFEANLPLAQGCTCLAASPHTLGTSRARLH